MSFLSLEKFWRKDSGEVIECTLQVPERVFSGNFIPGKISFLVTFFSYFWRKFFGAVVKTSF